MPVLPAERIPGSAARRAVPISGICTRIEFIELTACSERTRLGFGASRPIIVEDFAGMGGELQDGVARAGKPAIGERCCSPSPDP